MTNDQLAQHIIENETMSTILYLTDLNKTQYNRIIKKAKCDPVSYMRDVIMHIEQLSLMSSYCKRYELIQKLRRDFCDRA